MTLINPYKAGLAAAEWHSRLEAYIKDHNYQVLWRNAIDASADLSDDEKIIGKDMIDDFCDKLKSYSMATKKGLIDKQNDYISRTQDHAKLHEMLKHLFISLYSAFTSSKNMVEREDICVAYKILNLLDMCVCPYCNRAYTFAVYGKRKNVRPQFDHFYDKATYPTLAVSFYNLVPSCPICNYTKHSDSLNINPYFDEFEGKFKVSEKLVGKRQNEDDDEVEPKPLSPSALFDRDEWGNIHYYSDKELEKEDIKELGLDGLYARHDDYVEELLGKVQAYNDVACRGMIDSFQGAGHSPEQVRDFIFGNDIANTQSNNRPLSKLTRDILEQAGVIDSD